MQSNITQKYGSTESCSSIFRGTVRNDQFFVWNNRLSKYDTNIENEAQTLIAELEEEEERNQSQVCIFRCIFHRTTAL